MKSVLTILKLTVIMVALTAIGTHVSHAQQYPQYTQYMYNQMVINPSYAGYNAYTDIALFGRTQWTGIEGAPRTYSLSVSSPLMGEIFGIGGSIVGDEAGPVRETMMNLAGSFKLNLGENAQLAFGVNVGVSFLDVNFSDLFTLEPDDPILSADINSTYMNLGAGLFFSTKRFYAGISAPNLLKPTRIENNNGIVTQAAEEIHSYLTAGYVVDINESLKFKPSVLLYSVSGSPLKVDISGNLFFQDRFEFGLTYRPNDTVAGMFGVQLAPQIRIGYAYDYTTTPTFGPFASGTHEIMLVYSIGRYKVISPRYF